MSVEDSGTLTYCGELSIIPQTDSNTVTLLHSQRPQPSRHSITVTIQLIIREFNLLVV